MGQDANAVREKQSMKPTGHQDILVHNPDFLTSKISGDGFLIQRFFNPVSLASWRIRIGRPGARLRSGLSEGVRRHVDRCRSLAGSRDHSVASEGGAPRPGRFGAVGRYGVFAISLSLTAEKKNAATSRSSAENAQHRRLAGGAR